MNKVWGARNFAFYISNSASLQFRAIEIGCLDETSEVP